MALVEIHVLGPQPEALPQPQPGPVDQRRHQPGRALHGAQQRGDLRLAQHGRHPPGPLGPHHPVQVARLPAQHVAEDEHQRVERLALRGGRYGAVHREVAEEPSHVGGVPLPGPLRAGERGEAPGPVRVALLGPVGHVAGSDLLPQPADHAGAGRRGRAAPVGPVLPASPGPGPRHGRGQRPGPPRAIQEPPERFAGPPDLPLGAAALAAQPIEERPRGGGVDGHLPPAAERQEPRDVDLAALPGPLPQRRGLKHPHQPPVVIRLLAA